MTSSPDSTVAAHAGEGVAHQRMDGEERGADRIGGEHDGQRLRRQDRAAEVGQRRQILEQLPDLALRPAAIGRRVEQDDVVAAAAALLALGEFHRILDDPADRLVATGRAISWFSRAQPIAFLEASTWVTSAPARAATSEARPV